MYKHVNRVLVGSGANQAVVTDLPSIAKGDLVVLDEAGNVLTAATAALVPKYSSIQIGLGTGPGLAKLSSPIQGDSISKVATKEFVAPSELSLLVGYNGTAGTGIVIDEAFEYRLRVILLDSHRLNGQRQTFGESHVTGTGVLQDDVSELACLFGNAIIEEKIALERVSDGTFTALAANATVVEGMDIVTSAGHGLLAGDVVRIGGVTDTDAVYVVKSVIDANSFKLDTNYQGVSGTILAADIGGVTGIIEWGFKITGKEQSSPLDSGNTSIAEYQWINFDASFAGVADKLNTGALVTKLTSVYAGSGYWKQIRDIEEKAKHYEGDLYKRNIYRTAIPSNVVVGTEYNTIKITHFKFNEGDMSVSNKQPLETDIYIPTGGTQIGADFADILDAYLGKFGITPTTAVLV